MFLGSHWRVSYRSFWLEVREARVHARTSADERAELDVVDAYVRGLILVLLLSFSEGPSFGCRLLLLFGGEEAAIVVDERRLREARFEQR